MKVANIEGFECPFCSTLSEDTTEFKGKTYIYCPDCEVNFTGKIVTTEVFISEKLHLSKD